MRLERFDGFEREYMTDATRALLLDFAAGDLQRPLRRLDVDWEEMFQTVCRNGLLGLTYYYLSHHESDDYPPLTFRQSINRAHHLDALRMALMYRHLGMVLAALTDSGVDFIVVKGPAVAYTVYPQPTLRAFNDLDVIVREQDWATLHQTLLDLGFHAEEDLPHPPPKLVSQAVLYESKYRNEEIRLLIEVHYDDFINAGLASRDGEGFWQRASVIEIAGVAVKVLSLEDQLIHLCAHVHYHGYTRLNWLSDLAFVVRDWGPQVNWPRVFETVQTEDANVSVYYSLYFLEQLLDVAVPEGVLATLRPDRFRRWWHERLMPDKRVLSLQPMWRPDFSFYFIPLLKRLLPDLLVMGRRREKLRYLLRLLAPPRDWLCYYYGLGNTRIWPVHYVLHPLKLAYNYLAEIVTAVAKAF